MRTDLFDFDLPPDRIALRPVSPRDAAKLLVVQPGGTPELQDRIVRDLPDLLEPGDALVVNDTKVIPARLIGRRIGRGEEPRIEATLHKRLDGSRWRAFVRPAKRLVAGDVVRFGDEGKVCFLGQLDATVEEKGEGGEVTLSFAFHGAVLDQAIAERGEMPLPPYIASKRPADEADRSDYQTLFAEDEGSVAAPTAGLHFTEDLLARLRDARHRPASGHPACRGRHVPAGQGRRHVRTTSCMPNGARSIRGDGGRAQQDAGNAGGRIVAVGTTALRLLESATGEDRVIRPFAGETAIFITPGYRFRAVDLLMTNFHLPRSTLFMLVSAFSGLDTMKRAYAHALASGYRFYSYGDACLLHPAL